VEEENGGTKCGRGVEEEEWKSREWRRIKDEELKKRETIMKLENGNLFV